MKSLEGLKVLEGLEGLKQLEIKVTPDLDVRFPKYKELRSKDGNVRTIRIDAECEDEPAEECEEAPSVYSNHVAEVPELIEVPEVVEIALPEMVIEEPLPPTIYEAYAPAALAHPYEPVPAPEALPAFAPDDLVGEMITLMRELKRDMSALRQDIRALHAEVDGFAPQAPPAQIR